MGDLNISGMNAMKLEHNNDKNIQAALNKLAKKHMDSFTNDEFKCLTNTNSKTSQFYGLPKIHKSKILEAETKQQNCDLITCKEPVDLKLRPIISGPQCPTRNLSNLIDKILKPLLIHVKSYIKDSIHFLNKRERKVKRNALLITFDVSSLYTSIPHELGIEAITYFLENHPESIDQRFPTDFANFFSVNVRKNLSRSEES